MRKYKLKEESKKYFAENLRDKVESLEFWEYKGADLQAIEEIPIVRIEYGIDNKSSKALSGWKYGKGCRFHFTAFFSDTSRSDYNKIEKYIPSLMKDIEAVTKYFIETLDEKS